jgi:hypothetical protein
MATIIEMRFRQVQRAAATQGRAAGEVVIFPGVRHERWEDTQERARRGREACQRDLLELED